MRYTPCSVRIEICFKPFVKLPDAGWTELDAAAVEQAHETMADLGLDALSAVAQKVGMEQAAALNEAALQRFSETPEAKALREQREAEAVATPTRPDNSITGRKRSFAAFAQTPASVRDGRTDSVAPDRPFEAIKPARNFAKYVEYDFSKMTDTKGGFLTAEDDPHNEAARCQRRQKLPHGLSLLAVGAPVRRRRSRRGRPRPSRCLRRRG